MDINNLSTSADLPIDEAFDLDLESYVRDIDGGRKELDLAYPIIVKGRESGRGDFEEAVDTLTFRRPRGIDMDILDDTRLRAYASARKFVAALTGLDIKHVGGLDTDDLHRAMAVAYGFLPKPKSLQTGETTPDI